MNLIFSNLVNHKIHMTSIYTILILLYIKPTNHSRFKLLNIDMANTSKI